ATRVPGILAICSMPHDRRRRPSCGYWLRRGIASRVTTAPQALREPRRLLLRSHGLTFTDVLKPRCGRGHVEKGRSGLTGVCGARNVLPRAPEIGTSGRTVIRTGMPALTRHGRSSE